jgi:hypothetical protein
MIFGSWNLYITSLGVLLSTKWVVCPNHPVVGQETEACAKNMENWAQWVAARPNLWPVGHALQPLGPSQVPLCSPFSPKVCGDAQLHFMVHRPRW